MMSRSKRSSRNRIAPITKILIFAAVVAAVLWIGATGSAHERLDGGYFSIVDEQNQVVYLTGRAVEVGDQVLTENNRRYEIISLEGDTARAKFIGEVNLSQYLSQDDRWVWDRLLRLPRAYAAASNPKVAIYHTHSDESYVPSDGAESKKGAGGIYAVGAAFAESLKAEGITPLLSENKHDPHDNMAYERSRRTALSLVKQQPAAIFDIHRDAVPPQVYQAKVAGQDISKVQLVVGKYGPTGKQIEDYAMKIKAVADKKHPGLVKGIFFAKGGDYNQDLHPRSMLLEVGAHTNTKESAIKGVKLFADVIPSLVGKAEAAPVSPQQAGAQAGSSGASRSIGWILGLVAAGVAAFLFLSTGSLKEAQSKWKQFFTTEFANFFGPKRNKPDQPDKEESSEEQQNK